LKVKTTTLITAWSTSQLLEVAELNSELTPNSLLAEVRVSLEEIMDRFGHSDDQITKNVYLHVNQEIKKEASHEFSELMRSFFFSGIGRQITSCRP